MSDLVIAKRVPLSIAVFLLLLLALASGTGAVMLVAHLRTSNVESKTFADGAVSGLAADWSDQQLQERLSPAEQKRLKSVDLAELAKLRARMGRFERDLGTTGAVSYPWIHFFVGSLRATYAAKAIFVNGIATFHLGLIKLDGRWMIDSYHIDAQFLGRPTSDEFDTAVGLKP